jgi:hypothetical protein
MPVIVENIPASLRRQDRWVVWNWTWNPAKNGGQGGWDKPPLNARTGRKAKTNDPTTWVPFAEALAVHQSGRYDGVGVVLGELEDGRTLAGVDLDDVRDPETGALLAWASWVVARLVTYGEVSPSGQGVKLLAYGKLPRGRCDNHRGAEMYCAGRYFTITGHRLDGTPPAVWDRADMLADLHAELMDDGKPPADDDRERALEALAHLSDDRAANYRDWLGVGMALHAADNSDAMLAEWDRWSQRCPDKYRAGACAAKWPTFRGHGLGVGSLIYWARLDGWAEEQGPRLYSGGKPLGGNRKRAGHHQDNGQAGTPPPAPDAPPPEWDEVVPLAEVPPADPFPTQVFPAGIARFAVEASGASGVPVDFVALPILVIAGGAVGASRCLEAKQGWKQLPLVYAGIVGAPGDGKTPGLHLVAKPLHQEVARLKEQHAQAMEEYDRQAAAYRQAQKAADKKRDTADRPEPKKPQMPRIVVDNHTVEALAPILERNPRGIIAVKDELTTVVTSANQYKGGRGSDRQFWLQNWASAPVTVDRKAQDAPIIIRRPFVAVIGAIQPDLLATLRDERGRADGFLDRFLFAYPEPGEAPHWTWEEISEETMRCWAEPVAELLKLTQLPGEYGPLPDRLHLKADAKGEWQAIFNGLVEEQNAEDFPAVLRGPWSKLKVYACRLALIVHLLRWITRETEEKNVEAESVRRAGLLVEYFKSHTRKVYAAIDADPKVFGARRILRYLAAHPAVDGFTRADLYRQLRRHFQQPDALNGPLRMLVEHHYLRLAGAAPPGKRGPATDRFEVNPKWERT